MFFLSDLGICLCTFGLCSTVLAIVEETIAIHKAWLCSVPIVVQVYSEIRDKRVAQNFPFVTLESFCVSSPMPKPLQSYELSKVFTMTNHIWREWSLAQNECQTT